MRIVLDTNILYTDPLLQSTSARVLSDQMPRLGHTLHIPKVVDEMVNHYPKILREPGANWKALALRLSISPANRWSRRSRMKISGLQ